MSTRETDETYVNQQHLQGFRVQLITMHMADIGSKVYFAGIDPAWFA